MAPDTRGSSISRMPPKLSSSRLRSWDLALAGVVAVALVTEGQLRASGTLSAGGYLLAAAAAAPLAWRRRSPLAALVAVEIGAVLCAVAISATWVATAMVLVELYTVAFYGDRSRSLVVGTLTAIAVAVTIVLIDGSFDAGSIAIRVPMVFAAVALGDTRRARRALALAAAERAARLEREREAENRRQAELARLDIARDLHDTLAHALVEINVHAGVAAHVDDQDPAAALVYIKQASAQALNDLRATLSVLRDSSEPAPTTPSLTLAAVPELVRRAQAAGLAADAEIRIDGASVPAAVGQASFRIVQEALTNVLRHADATSTHVRIVVDADDLEIAVSDDGRGGASATNGHGLRGMRERVAALGGQLQAGPRTTGGWLIRARLPLRARARG